MSKLLSASLPRPLPQSMEESRAWITLMFLLRGMPFVDLAHLRKTDLQDSVISYRRHKTGTLLTVEIPRCHEPYQTVSKYRLRLPLPAFPFSVETGKAKKNMQNTNMPCGN